MVCSLSELRASVKADGKERSAHWENLKMSIEFPAGEGKLPPPSSLPLPLLLRTKAAKGFKDICEGGPSQQGRAARGQRPVDTPAVSHNESPLRGSADGRAGGLCARYSADGPLWGRRAPHPQPVAGAGG